MNALASIVVLLALFGLTLAVARHYLNLMGVPARWVSLGAMVRILVRTVGRIIRGTLRVAAGTVRLVQRRRRAHPIPHYTTLRLPQLTRRDWFDG